MIIRMSLMLCIPFLLLGCKHTETPVLNSEVSMFSRRPQCAEVVAREIPREGIRTHDVLKAYPIGRYIDPNNPNIMHEGHVIYRQEAPSAWNTHPNSPIAVPLGPTVAISRPEHHPSALVSEYETKIVQQNQLMEAILSENESLIEMINELKNEIRNIKN